MTLLLMKDKDDCGKRVPPGLHGRPKISSGTAQALLMHSWQLPSSYREVYILCEIQRLSVPEVAATLGRDVAAIKAMLDEARDLMREVTQKSKDLPFPREPVIKK